LRIACLAGAAPDEAVDDIVGELRECEEGNEEDEGVVGEMDAMVPRRMATRGMLRWRVRMDSRVSRVM
jgi:hypothetical protein